MNFLSQYTQYSHFVAQKHDYSHVSHVHIYVNLKTYSKWNMSHTHSVFTCRTFGHIYIYMHHAMIYNYSCGNRLNIET